MSDWITIAGVRPYDGRYELDLHGSPLTTREWGWIKRHAGYVPGTINDAAYSDPELIAVLAVITLRRNGLLEPREVPAAYDRLQDQPAGPTITIEFGDVEAEDDDAGPPASSSSENASSSGHDSPTSSESSGPRPSHSGTPRSATSVSVPAKSAS